MPWDMQDYPDSMKNMEPLVRKKAIDIANALEDEGYEEDRLIPIAHSQAQEWYDDASEEEKEEFENEDNPQKNDDHETSANVDLVDNDIEVFYEDDEWKVQTKGSERAAETFENKPEAVERAEEMALNKESKVIIYKQDGDVQSEKEPTDN